MQWVRIQISNIAELVLNYLQGRDLLMIGGTCNSLRDLIDGNSVLKKKMSSVKLTFNEISNPKREIKVNFAFKHLQIQDSREIWSICVYRCRNCKKGKICELARARENGRVCQNNVLNL